MSKLGDTQLRCLAILREGSRLHHDYSGTWSAYSGWYWSSQSGTTRIMESLLKRGLVSKHQDERGVAIYTITEEGKNYEQ